MVIALGRTTPKFRKKMIQHAPKEVINCVSECCYNVLKGNVSLSEAQKRSNPRGWQEFSRGLRESNVPQEYVGNRQRWLWMQRDGSEDEDDGDEYFETSSYLPATPPPQNKSNADNYPYRAYIENLLPYNKECKDTQMQALELWSKDSYLHMQDNTAAGSNESWKFRKKKPVSLQATHELIGRLHLDLFLREKYLPNGIEIPLKLNRSPTAFCLMGTADGKVDIQQVGFNVRTVDLLPVVANDLNKNIAQHNMKIPIRRAVVKTFTIPDGLRSKIDDHLFLGQLPKRIIIGMVKNSDMNGDERTNPFDFQHFSLSKFEVSIDGKTIHNKPYTPDNGEYLRSYMSLYQATGALGANRSIDLSMAEYKKGYTFWGFDLTADQGSEGQLHPIKTGNMRRDIQFGEALPAIINVIVYAEFDNQIEINELREIITDY
ncbi:uncharacterized protein F54H12.2-like [Mercenaria mercenaria]|uniref:uncharacterized protein F54H12.2-like n=1 Tax=Mercenaria mercenaria TaxID=6596 RepID=UPI00234E96AD|nr:uncharacterized protein F54H12.2-like [Mercenaria mercenaria]